MDGLTRRQLTAPHYLAYSYVLSRMRQTDAESCLDFGSRYSLLPSFLARAGFSVTAYDRDDGVLEWQRKIGRQYNLNGKLKAVTVLPAIEKSIDAITAVWAVQHNDIFAIPKIVRTLFDLLKPGGSLLYVGSFTPEKTFHQTDRKDPQWVMDQAAYQENVIDVLLHAGGMLIDQQCFRYQHNSESGEFCDTGKANATCLHVVRSRV